tara:strand:- start:327 stop:3146 length:2820 start_codon:yes stop_codon:yes gene_type:complete
MLKKIISLKKETVEPITNINNVIIHKLVNNLLPQINAISCIIDILIVQPNNNKDSKKIKKTIRNLQEYNKKFLTNIETYKQKENNAQSTIKIVDEYLNLLRHINIQEKSIFEITIQSNKDLNDLYTTLKNLYTGYKVEITKNIYKLEDYINISVELIKLEGNDPEDKKVNSLIECLDKNYDLLENKIWFSRETSFYLIKGLTKAPFKNINFLSFVSSIIDNFEYDQTIVNIKILNFHIAKTQDNLESYQLNADNRKLDNEIYEHISRLQKELLHLEKIIIMLFNKNINYIHPSAIKLLYDHSKYTSEIAFLENNKKVILNTAFDELFPQEKIKKAKLQSNIISFANKYITNRISNLDVYNFLNEITLYLIQTDQNVMSFKEQLYQPNNDIIGQLLTIFEKSNISFTEDEKKQLNQLAAYQIIEKTNPLSEADEEHLTKKQIAERKRKTANKDKLNQKNLITLSTRVVYLENFNMLIKKLDPKMDIQQDAKSLYEKITTFEENNTLKIDINTLIKKLNLYKNIKNQKKITIDKNELLESSLEINTIMSNMLEKFTTTEILTRQLYTSEKIFIKEALTYLGNKKEEILKQKEFIEKKPSIFTKEDEKAKPLIQQIIPKKQKAPLATEESNKIKKLEKQKEAAELENMAKSEKEIKLFYKIEKAHLKKELKRQLKKEKEIKNQHIEQLLMSEAENDSKKFEKIQKDIHVKFNEKKEIYLNTFYDIENFIKTHFGQNLKEIRPYLEKILQDKYTIILQGSAFFPISNSIAQDVDILILNENGISENYAVQLRDTTSEISEEKNISTFGPFTKLEIGKYEFNFYTMQEKNYEFRNVGRLCSQNNWIKIKSQANNSFKLLLTRAYEHDESLADIININFTYPTEKCIYHRIFGHLRKLDTTDKEKFLKDNITYFEKTKFNEDKIIPSWLSTVRHVLQQIVLNNVK